MASELRRVLLERADFRATDYPDCVGTSPLRSERVSTKRGSPLDITVVKVGGRLLAHPEHLDATLGALASAAQDVPILVVPGGGAFADAIRDVDRQVGLPEDAAHWMAVLAMDQYGHLLASRMTNARLVGRLSDATTSLENGRTPVLAPYQWLREADPLPHSWDATSDTISAWVAGQAGATRLVLVKPPNAVGPGIVDACFERFLPAHVKAEIVTADRIAELQRRLTARV